MLVALALGPLSACAAEGPATEDELAITYPDPTGKADGADDLATLINATSNGMRAYADVTRAEGDFLMALGKARYDGAKAAYVDALRAGQVAKVQQLTLYLEQLEKDFRRLNRAIYQNRTKTEQIESRARTLSVLKAGRTSSSVWAALDYFLRNIVTEPAFQQAVALPVVDAARTPDNFVPNRDGDEALAFEGADAGALLGFLEDNDYSLEKWSPAHRVILKAVFLLSEPAAARLAELTASTEAIRKGTYDVWNPPDPDAGFWGPVPAAW